MMKMKDGVCFFVSCGMPYPVLKYLLLTKHQKDIRDAE